MPRLLTRLAPPLGQSFTQNYASPQARGLVYWLPSIGQGAPWARELVANQPPTKSGTVVLEGQPVMGLANKLDGTSGYFTLPNLGSRFSTEVTLTCWVKLRNNTPADIVQTGLGELHDQSGTNSHYPYVNNLIYINLLRSDRPSADNTAFDKTAWHLLVITHRASSAAGDYVVYQNLSVALSATADASLPTWLASPSWGKNLAQPYYLDGWTADFRLYNRFFTLADVAGLYLPQTRWDLYLPAKSRRSGALAVVPVRRSWVPNVGALVAGG